MKPSQALDVVALMGASWKTEIPEPTVRIWAEMLLDLEYDEAVAAVKEASATEEWASIAAVRKAAAGRGANVPAPEEAWAQVVRAIRTDDWDQCHPVAAECARCIGTHAIAMSDETETWMQSHFVRLYKARADRVVHERNVVPMLEAGADPDFAKLAGEILKELPS